MLHRYTALCRPTLLARRADRRTIIPGTSALLHPYVARPSPRTASKITLARTASYWQKARGGPPLQSSHSGAWFVVGAVCVAVSGTYCFFGARNSSQSLDKGTASPAADCIALDMAQLLPGRPGNLTIDQEVKLQDLWKATFKVFGVHLGPVRGMSDTINGPLDVEDEDEADEEDTKADPDAKSGEKEKKKRKRNIFGRKKKEKDEKDTKSEKEAEHMPTTTDDKYGQTKEYMEALEKNKPEALRGAFWGMCKADHPDALMLRFLRARKWDVEKALVMMISTLNWRLNEMKVDEDVMINGESTALEKSQSSNAATKKVGDDFMAQLRMGKSFLHGTDKEGRPMCFVRVRLHRQGEQAEPSLERFTVYTIETARLMLVPPIDTAAIVFDMTGFSMANMDYGPVKFMIKCFEANYPESLGVVLVHKAPWIFQGIWKIIRGWLDPVVAGKVHFTNNTNELETYVARDHIPKELGGDEDWTYEYPEPIENENKAVQDTATRDQLSNQRDDLILQYEDRTKRWIRGPPDAADIKAQRTELAEKLKNNYWKLDPYVRARSLYDRVGLIGKDGVLTFYPGKTHPAAGGAAQEVGAIPPNVEGGEAKDTMPADSASGAALVPSVSGGPSQLGLGVARAATPQGGDRDSQNHPSRTPSRHGPVPAGHEEDGVD